MSDEYTLDGHILGVRGIPVALDTSDLVTLHDPPPIPLRQFDWSARRDGYDQGDPLGFGGTEAEAVADLLEQEADRRGGDD